jgi:hypothetical protein
LGGEIRGGVSDTTMIFVLVFSAAVSVVFFVRRREL